MKPMAPMPMELPSVFSSSSSAAIFGSGFAGPHSAQARRLLAEHHADVLGAAETDADDRRLAGETALAEGDAGVEEEALDALDTVGGEQHAVVGAEQPALVHGGEIDPGGVRMERVFDLWCADAAVVVVVRAQSGCTRLGRSGTLCVALAVARRSAASSAMGPPSTRASLPIFTYHRGVPVSPHMASRLGAAS